MISTDICRHCDQYHNSCKSAKQFQNMQDTKFLKFKDLYKAGPKPHIQNFSMNSKRKLGNNRLVYDVEQYCYGKSLRYGHGMKIGQISRKKQFAQTYGDVSKYKTEKGKKNSKSKIQISKRPLKTENCQLKTSRQKFYGFHMTPVNREKGDKLKEVTDTVERTQLKTNNSIAKNIVESRVESWQKNEEERAQDLKILDVCSWNQGRSGKQKRCSYFDNRCLGFDCSQVGEIHVLQEYHLR